VPRHLMLVLSNARDGREGEFNAWYDGHLRDTIDKLDGFAAAQRFELAAGLDGAPDVPYRYLAVYEIEDDRIARAFEQFLHGRQERAEATAAGRPPMISVSDSLDPSAFLVGFYSALADPVPSRRLSGGAV
jgi:hypothetical protein